MSKIALAGAALALAVFQAQAQVTWDLPTPYPDANFHTRNIAQFASEVKQATNGRLQIKIHSAGSLFKHPEIKNAVRGRQVPIGEFLLSRLSNENAVFEVDSVPFLATSFDEAKRLWDASRKQTAKLLDREGLMVLFAVPWPPQALFAKSEVHSVDDLKGVKFRAYNTATERLAVLAGAVPTQVEVPDIPQAFTTGRVETMMTSASTAVNTKAWDFVTHYYDTQAWLPKNIVVVNKRAFRSLDKNTQTALLEAAQAAEQRGWDMSMKETADQTEVLKKNGMAIHAPSPELMKGLKAIGKQLTKEWLQKAGAQGQAILEAYGAD